MILAVALEAADVPFQPQAASAEETVIYVVRRGDTLDRLSRSFLVPERRWRALLTLAGIRDPRQLPVGRRLVIPRSWLRYTIEPARLASYRGTVRISLGGRPAAPAVGMAVGEGAEIATAANSFVTLILADRSKIVIPSQSSVRVRQLRRILLTGAVDYRLDVEAGRLETKVPPLDRPGARYRIRTPISMTAVRGTEFRVAFGPDTRAAATEVLEGSVAFSDPEGGRGIALDSSFGATVGDNGAPRIEKLLPAPDLVEPGRVQTRDMVEFRAAPAAGAQRYRAVVASDAGFVENLAEQVSENGTFAIPDIPNGTLFVRISAIASSGLEGMAQSYSFVRRLASIHAAVDQLDDGYRFRWFGAGGGARRFRFQLMRDDVTARPLVDRPGLEQDALTLRALPPGVYYWRVGLTQVEDGEVVESWTDPEKLTIAQRSRRAR